MNFVWDPRNIPVTLPPNDFDQIPDILWTKLKGTPTQAVDRGILQYTYADVQRCISESYCVLTLSICFIIFIFLSLFILTILLLYLISSIRSLLSQIYCIFYQMTYAVSPSVRFYHRVQKHLHAKVLEVEGFRSGTRGFAETSVAQSRRRKPALSKSGR